MNGAVSLPQAAVDRLNALVVRYSLATAATASFSALLVLLAEDPHAPTTVRDPVAAADEHVADSLVALELQEVRTAIAIADLGAGAGFPGLPLAIALPDAAVALVESNARKCAFIKRAVAAAGLTNASVIHARAEAWRDGLGRFDLVTARALAPLAVLAEYAAPLLRPGGVLVAWRGRRDEAGESAAAFAATELGLEVSEPVHVHPFVGAEHRHLHLMLKVRETPPRFPRRPGVALKRPLGAGLHGPSDRAPR
jgi:16S rRNA (guanine527-N7)-methyltransferase